MFYTIPIKPMNWFNAIEFIRLFLYIFGYFALNSYSLEQFERVQMTTEF